MLTTSTLNVPFMSAIQSSPARIGRSMTVIVFCAGAFRGIIGGWALTRVGETVLSDDVVAEIRVVRIDACIEERHVDALSGDPIGILYDIRSEGRHGLAEIRLH